MSRGWANMGQDFEAYTGPQDFSSIETRLDPEYVAPLVLYLVSEQNKATHGLYSAVAGRYARVFTGVTPGWYGPADRPASPEELAAHWAEVEDQTGYTVPFTHNDEVNLVLNHYTEK